MFNIEEMIKEKLKDPEILLSIKQGIISELRKDELFKDAFKEILNIKEPVIILNGTDVKIEVRK
jgi:hypothetical protein